MEVKLIAITNYLDGDTPEELLEHAGRVCYRSQSKGEPGKFIQARIREGHESLIEHTSATFEISGISRACCYDADTEVLTKDGWEYFADIDSKNRFCTLNPETHEIEYQSATRFYAGEYQGPMYYLHSTKIELLVTPNHRMYIYPHDTQRARRAGAEGKHDPGLWEIKHADEIAGKRVAYKKTGFWKQPDLEMIEIPATEVPCRWGMRDIAPLVLDADVFLEFLGYYIADGNLHHSEGTGYGIVLTQKKGKTFKRMREVIQEMGFTPRTRDLPGGRPPQIVFCSYQLYQYLKQLGTQAHQKRLPRSLLHWISRRQCNILLNALVTGDGSRFYGNGPWRYYTTSSQLADGIQELVLKAGCAANIRMDDSRVGQKHSGPLGEEIYFRHPMYVISILMRQNVPLVNHDGRDQDEWIDYEGMVYCVEVPNGLLYVRRNGKAVWCGNSHQLVRHRLASYSQESQRYTDMSNPQFVIPPDIAANPRAMEVWNGVVDELKAAYRELRELGIRKEDARFLLPNATATRIVMTMNFREIRHFIKLRTDPAAQWEIRELANRVLDILYQVAPPVFQDLVDARAASSH